MAPAVTPRAASTAAAAAAAASGKLKRPDFLHVLLKRKKNPGAMRKLIDLADKDEIEAISEIIYNSYRGNIHLSPSLIKQLAKNRRAAQRLLSSNISLLEKKRILKTKQVGGFLGALLGSLGSLLLKPLVGAVVGGLTRRRRR
jgi:hypothetical protein